MAKIELSIESNINSLIARGMFTGYKIRKEDIDALVFRIYKNFYSPHGEAVAAEARYMWKTFHDRDATHRLFTVAHTIEQEWRAKNRLRTFVCITTSQHAYEHIPLQSLLDCPIPTLHEIQNIFKTMHRTDFESTRYWHTVKSATLQHLGHECQATVGNIPCGIQVDLHVVPRTDDIVQGTEHMTYKDTLTVLCERHKLLYVGRNVAQSGAYEN